MTRASGRIRVLVIDDQARTADAIARRTTDADANVELVPVSASEGGTSGAPRRHARCWREARPWIAPARRRPDAVVLDLRFDVADEDLLPDERPLGESAAARRLRQERRERQGLLILERLRRAAPDLPVILTTAYEEIPFEQEAARLRADAFTYAVGEESANVEEILRLVRRAVADRESPPATGRFFWGTGSAMRDLRRRVLSLAPTPMPLLVTGPTGTGKNLLVREVVHPTSGRKGPLVAFDCATVPEGLLQASLFGVVRGAFTGAVVDRAGVFEAAARGTLFLDEIENLSADAQKMLLTALNDGRIRRVGASADAPHSARVVAASNARLEDRASEGRFRRDLLMRLNPALRLELPPLSERRADLPELARFCADAFFADESHRRRIADAVRDAGGDPSGSTEIALGDDAPRDATAVFRLPRKAWAAMLRHPWPGNLRQFEMLLDDALASTLYGGPPPRLEGGGAGAGAVVVFDVEARPVFDLLAGALATEGPGARLALDAPRASSVAAFRRSVEREAFRALFRESGGSFERMSERMTGSARHARAARLRFNRLGLSVRGER